MNILYIFGNGFDKAQGMATSYPEFYKYLQEHVTSSSNLLNQMKAEITEDRKLWSDMEERLGAFTDVSNNADEFYDFYFELNEHLQSYLTKENEKFLPTGRASFEDSYLSRLALKSGLMDELSEEQMDFIDSLEPLNIEARYPSYKELLMKVLTPEYCKELLNKTKTLQLWIKGRL